MEGIKRLAEMLEGQKDKYLIIIVNHLMLQTEMNEAFLNEEDIHKQVASKVFNVPLEEVTKEQRTAAKAVNFGIVYGISGFGLAEQLGISRKKAEQYIEQYLEKYKGVKEFMDRIEFGVE